jgi:glycosyltransferase involved in cell wall biosynthesis
MLISHYQFRRWIEKLNLPPAKGFLTQNGISLEKFKVDEKKLTARPPRAYYASTPFRGLALIPDLWPLVTQMVPEAELVVCSSFATYGISERDDNFKELFLKLESIPSISYRAAVGQEELREISCSSRVLAYPCIFPETGCIAAMEAMASGCVVAGTDLGALPETAWRNPLFPLEAGGLDRWIDEVVRLLVDDAYYLDYATQNLYLAQMMDWKRIARRWMVRFEEDFKKRAA